jgi:hypothetical protein
MKKITDVRRILKAIPGAFVDIDPEETNHGYQAGIRTLWEPTESQPEEPDLGSLADEKGGEQVNLDMAAASTEIEEIFEFGAEIDQDRLQAAMNGAEGDKIRQAVLEKGVDALGWYVPFHAKGAQWGIYVPMSGIAHIMVDFIWGLNTDLLTKFRIAFRAIHQHELFHFAVEYMAGQWEALTEKPCWNPARGLKDATRGYNLLEEECANAHMMRSFLGGRSSLRVAGRTSAMRNFVRRQPPGYREGDHKREALFTKRCELLARRYVGCIRDSRFQALDAFELMRTYPPLFPNLNWTYVPIHILNDGTRIGLPPNLLGLFRSIESVEESDRFARRLATLPIEIGNAWIRLKSRIKNSLALPGIDFKQWERNEDGVVYSVRVSKSYRAHLLRTPSGGPWLALNIGTHKEMGHG